MSIRLEKPWRSLDAEAVADLRGQLGVYQLGDAGGNVLYIGYAGGRSRFGLRGELEACLGRAERFRVEVNMSYLTRWRELLMAFEADHGRLPELNGSARLGRLQPD